MFHKRHHPLTVCLVLFTAFGLSLTAFAGRPPCACAAKRLAEAKPACPHCAKAQAKLQDCCRGMHAPTDDCKCPCCHSTPADQPLIVAAAGVAVPDQLTSPHFLDTSYSPFLAFQTAYATRGGRDGPLAIREAPRLEQLCRWII